MANEYVIYHLSVEGLHTGITDPPIRLHSLSAEVLHSGPVDPEIRIHALSAEVLHTGVVNPPIRIYSLAVEVLRTIDMAFDPDFLDDGGVVYAPEYVEDINLVFVDDGVVFGPSLTDEFNLAFYEDTGSTAVFSLRFEPTELRQPIATTIESNPYRPDAPQHLADLDPGLYDYLRDQAELIRDQHNKTQAGDSTFPWQLMTTPGDRAAHTPGSVTRFVHDTYGLLLGRYVKFSDNWDSGDNPVVGHDKTRADWTATNQKSKTDLFRVIGFSGPHVLNPSNSWGWALTHGRGFFPIVVISELMPQQFQKVTWSLDESGMCEVGAGPAVAILLNGTYSELLDQDDQSYDPKRWTIPAGGWYAQVEGVTPEYIEATASLVLPGILDRLDALENAAGADYQSQIDSLQGSLNGLTTALATESSTRAATDSGLNVRVTALESVAFGGYVTLTAFNALDIRVTALETLTGTINTNLTALSTTTNARLNNLESWQTTAISQIDGLTIALAGFLDPQAIDIEFTAAGTISAVNVQAAIEELDSDIVALTSTVAANSAAIADIQNGYTFTGDISVPDEAYGVGWNASLEVPTKNAVYDKIELVIASIPAAFVAEDARVALSVSPTSVSASTYTLVIADAYEYIRLSHASGCAVTVPANASVAFPVGTTITFRTTASAASSFVPDTGVTLNKVGGGTGTQAFAEIGATAQLKKVSTNEWDIIGGMA